MVDLPKRCPPHDFRQGWQSDDRGMIFCRMCGDIRNLEAQLTPEPEDEKIANA